MRNANRSRPRCVALALLAPWLLASAPAAQPPRPAAAAADPVRCAPGNGGIRLPEGFCAAIVADDVGPARHIVVAPNGDVFVAIRNRSSARGGILVLRDTTGDGAADIAIRFGENGGTGIALRAGYLYFGTDDAVLRYPLPAGSLTPAGPPDTIVAGLPYERSHSAKSIAVTDRDLFVNIGSPSNVCTARNAPGTRGPDPCPELETRAGIWRFDPDRTGQRQRDGIRYATGVRNAVALAVHPTNGGLYAVQHGRDALSVLWPDLFTHEKSAETPSEELIRVDRGDDFGWPYCYHDLELGRKVLAPEYGGNGRDAGRCADVEEPILAFPGHWGPNGLLFYTGSQFPARYRGGAFIAFHGSWNRAPLPQDGYRVVFVPFEGDAPAGGYEDFATGFAGADVSPRGAAHRPVGLAQAPDGSLYITDDQGGRIWRVVYAAGRR